MSKKVMILFGVIIAVSSCNSRTYDEISDPLPEIQSVNYMEHVKPIVDANCIVCHSSGGVMSSYPLTNYNLVKNAIDNMIDRIERPVGDPQKMPQGGSLSSADISVIKQWKVDGLLEQ